jgi:hypothetical protein
MAPDSVKEEIIRKFGRQMVEVLKASSRLQQGGHEATPPVKQVSSGLHGLRRSFTRGRVLAGSCCFGYLFLVIPPALE